MANYTFDASAQGFSGMAWEGSVGSPGLGALAADGVNSASAILSSLSIPVIADDPFSFRFRVISDGSGDSGNVTVTLKCRGVGTYETGETVNIPAESTPIDTGWLYRTGAFDGVNTIDEIEVAAVSTNDGVLFTIYVDSIYVAESPPGDAVQLYQGIDSLTQRLTLPFTRVGVGGLAVRFDGRVALANDASEESPLIISAGPEDDYGSYDDETNDHPEEAVKRVVWIWT